MKSLRLLLILVLPVFFSACKKEKDENPPIASACKSDLPPIVMAHGLLGSGDTYANQVMRFGSNGFCQDRMFAFDWNSLDTTVNTSIQLDAFIDEVLQKTGASKVVLMGHSAGGRVGYDYLADAARAAKVSHYVHIGSFANAAPAGPGGSVPTLNIYSPNDEVVNGADIPGATNVSIPGKDHYEVATCAEAFDAMYRFIRNGEAPAGTQILAENNISISGRALTLGENNPSAGATIKIYETVSSSGERKSSDPIHTLTADSKGYWGPVSAEPGKTYEFEVISARSGDRIIHYYREAFVRSNPLVYLRTLPSSGGIAGLITGSIPSNDAQAAAVVFSSNQAVLTGRDVLRVQGQELSNATFCSAAATSIAFFLYDGNNNGTTELNSQGFFGSFPFLEAVDMFFPTTAGSSINCEINGRSLNAKAWKSATEGVTILVLD
jgi:triacylglycerol lipase